MQDVAKAANVSLGTVSNVINHPHKVSERTRHRVRAAIESLGFVRNEAARSLASGSNKSIGFLLADIENSLFIDLAHGAQEAALEAGFNLLLANTACDLSLQDQYLDLFDQARVTGILLAPMEDSSAGVARMRDHGRQIVLLNYAPARQTCCAVLENNERTGFLAAEHLISLGRTRLAYVFAQPTYQPVRDRRLGVLEAVAMTNGAVTVEELETGGLTFEHGRVVGRQLLERRDEELPDGLVVVTDDLAHGIIQELYTVPGKEVPERVAVIGCENNRSIGAGPVPLSAVDAPGRSMGAEAVRLLLDEVMAPQRHRHATVVLEPDLIVRQSTRANAPGRLVRG